VTCKGCQGFIGPIPSAFLDKYLKNWRKGKGAVFKLPNNFSCIPKPWRPRAALALAVAQGEILLIGAVRIRKHSNQQPCHPNNTYANGG
jgi:hypothetical protein